MGCTNNCVRNEKKGKKEKRTRCGKVVVVCGVAVEGSSFPLCWCLPWAFAFVFVLVVVVEATLPASKHFTSVFLVRDLSSFYRTSCSPSLEQNESLPPKRSPHWTLLEVLKTRYLCIRV